MPASDGDEREIRAARNQTAFRAINHKLVATGATRGTDDELLVIVCECANPTCVETLEIAADEYAAIRREPNRFAVKRGHVDRDVELVVDELDRYVTVEKTGAGAEIAVATAGEAT